MKSPIENKNILIAKNEELTPEEMRQFAYFGVGAKIKPPLRILNPQRIRIGDRTSIQEYCHINAFADLSFLRTYVEDRYRDDFTDEQYRYDAHIEIGKENQLGRFLFISCTNKIVLEDNVLISERVFIGDNNHTFSHMNVPIMQQPNQIGEPILIGKGSWIGAGAALLKGTVLGNFSVVGANSVVKDSFPDHSVIGPEPAKLLFVNGTRL